MRKLLIGHTSPETAFVQPDYPYGRELRCKRRVWIETKEGHGQRFVYQTTNPKRAGEVWNKPHASTYSTIKIMYLDESNGHVEVDGLSLYTYDDTIEAFVAQYGEEALCADPWIASALKYMRKVATKRTPTVQAKCVQCQKPEHDTCSLTPGCSCCDETMRRIVGAEMMLL